MKGFWEIKYRYRQVAKRARARVVGIYRRKIFEKQEAQRAVDRRAERKVGNRDLYYEVPDELKFTEDYVDSVDHNREFNDVYSEYYSRWYSDTNLATYDTLARRMQTCHKFWYGDHYRMQRIFDVKRVQLCHDKFCVNCQHLKQASILKRFTPVFDELRQTNDLYHLSLTVPNVSGSELKHTIRNMFCAFKKIMRYFSCDAKIKGVDFSQYGCVGAVRCLEIVTNPTDYHPHIHCALLLKKDLPLYKDNVNCYSFDKGMFKRKFSDLEILIQKIWWLALHNQKVDLNNIEAVPLGYSCMLNEVEESGWHEVFKYVTKLTKDGMPYLSDEQFRTLYTALYRCKVMQGYGCLYRVAENDKDDNEVTEVYAEILARLRAFEKPDKDTVFDIDMVLQDLKNKNITFISKRQVWKWLEECRKLDALDHPF